MKLSKLIIRDSIRLKIFNDDTALLVEFLQL